MGLTQPLFTGGRLQGDIRLKKALVDQPIIKSQPWAHHQAINKSSIVYFYKNPPTLTNKIYYGGF